jgi:hypothetical protein
MSKTKERNLDENQRRVQVGKLEQQEKELKDRQAENVKGGGGAAGGVVGSRNIGEEIPS